MGGRDGMGELCGMNYKILSKEKLKGRDGRKRNGDANTSAPPFRFHPISALWNALGTGF